MLSCFLKSSFRFHSLLFFSFHAKKKKKKIFSVTSFGLSFSLALFLSPHSTPSTFSFLLCLHLLRLPVAPSLFSLVIYDFTRTELYYSGSLCGRQLNLRLSTKKTKKKSGSCNKNRIIQYIYSIVSFLRIFSVFFFLNLTRNYKREKRNTTYMLNFSVGKICSLFTQNTYF